MDIKVLFEVVNIYNIKIFSDKLRDLRLENNLTQEEVAALALISKKTLSRIENGTVIPKIETLEVLSDVYNTDLIKLYLESRYINFELFSSILANIDILIEKRLFDELISEKNNLERLESHVEAGFLKIRIDQYILFIDSILAMEKGDIARAKILTSKALKLTKENFDANNYENFSYSTLELRLLMILAKVYYLEDSYEIYTEILSFCFSSVDPRDKFFISTCINLGNVYKRDANYEKALEVFNLGLEAALKNNYLAELDLLFFAKGSCEYKLGLSIYKDSFSKALDFCTITGKNQTKILIEKKIKKYFT